MACGRPVIGSRAGGIPEIIDDGETGFLAPPGDPDALAARIAEVLTRPELAARLARAAREKAVREFDTETVCARMAEYYHGLLRPVRAACAR
jgi:glycosyltransferase involved in cell wall biosynthesis